MSVHTACSLLGRAFTAAATLAENGDRERASVYREIADRYRDEAATLAAVTLTSGDLTDARHVLALATCWRHLTAEEPDENLARAALAVGVPGDLTGTEHVDRDTLRAVQQAASLVAVDIAGWLPSTPDGEAAWAHHALLSARRILAGASCRPVSA